MTFYLSNLRHLKDLQTTCNCCCKPAAWLLSCHQLCNTQRRCPTASGNEGKELLEDICENHSQRRARPTTPLRRWALFLLPFMPEVFGFSYASWAASVERKWTPTPRFSRPSGTWSLLPNFSPPPLPTLLFSPSETSSWRQVIKKHEGGLKKERWHCVAAWFFGRGGYMSLIWNREQSGPRRPGQYRGVEFDTSVARYVPKNPPSDYRTAGVYNLFQMTHFHPIPNIIRSQYLHFQNRLLCRVHVSNRYGKFTQISIKSDCKIRYSWGDDAWRWASFRRQRTCSILPSGGRSPDIHLRDSLLPPGGRFAPLQNHTETRSGR